MASYSLLWPAVGVTRSLYLKELYVAAGWQRQGIGTLLMDSLPAVAAKHGCSRVEWTTDRDSEGAQRCYAKLGVPINEGELFYRVELGDS